MNPTIVVSRGDYPQYYYYDRIPDHDLVEIGEQDALGAVVRGLVGGWQGPSWEGAALFSDKHDIFLCDATADELYDRVLAPTIARHGYGENDWEWLHQQLGDDDLVIFLVESKDPYAAAAIWSGWTVRVSRPEASPDEPVPPPPHVIANSVPSQGMGPLPPTSPAVLPPPAVSARDTSAPAAEPAPGAPGRVRRPRTYETAREDTRTAGDPVILFSGQLYYQVVDLEAPGRGLGLRFMRTYLHKTRYYGPLGFSWDHSYNLWLREERELTPGGVVQNVVYRSNGCVREDRYQQIVGQPVDPLPELSQTPDAEFLSPPGYFDRLRKIAGQYVLETQDGTTIFYGDTLQAEKIRDRNENALELHYDADRRLDRITDPVGKVYVFEYDELNRLRRLRDEAGRREVLFTLGDNGDLLGVDVAPDGELAVETDYEYLGPDAPRDLQHNLVRVINPLGRVTLETEYGDDPGSPDYNRVVSQWSESGYIEYQHAAPFFNVDPVAPADDEPWNAVVSTTTVKDARGHVVEHRCNEQGNVVQRIETVPELDEPIALVLRYDEDGQLIEEIRPDGSSTMYHRGRQEYAALHGDCSLATVEERMAFALVLRHVLLPDAASGELRRIVTELTYTSDRLLQSVRGPYYADLGLIPLAQQIIPSVTYEYDGRGNLLGARFPDVTVPARRAVEPLVFTYDGLGRLTDARRGPAGTHFDYFPDLLRSGFRSRSTEDPAGAALATQFEADALGRVTRVTNPYGAVDEHRWNGFDLLTGSTRADPGHQQVEMELTYTRARQPAGGTLQIRDRLDQLLRDGPLVWGQSYDQYGRLIETREGPATNPAERRRKTVLGPDGQVDRFFDTRGVELRFERDELGRVTSILRAVGLPEASRRHLRYGPAGSLSEVVDGLGRSTTFRYDGFGRVRLIRRPDGVATERTYDASGRPLSVEVHGPLNGTDVLWSREESAYDEVGRCWLEDRWLFEPGTNAPGTVLRTVRVYDELDRLVEIREPGGAVTKASYDSLLRRLTLTDADGNLTSFAYDDVARTQVETQTLVGRAADGSAASFMTRATTRFDRRGFPVEHTDPAGNTWGFTIDSRNELVSQRDPLGVEIALELDVYGQLRARTDDVGGAPIHTSLEYDTEGELVAVVDDAKNRTEWVRDDVGRVRELRRGSLVRRCQHDAEDQQILEQDENGTILRTTHTPAGFVETQEADLSAFVPPPSNPSYRPVAAGKTHFSYTPFGRIRTAVNDVAQIVRRYDSLGRQLQETVGGLSLTTSYDDTARRARIVYPGGRTIEISTSAAGELLQIDQLTAGSDYPGNPNAAAKAALVAIQRIGPAPTRIVFPSCQAANAYDDALRPVGVDWLPPGGGAPIFLERRLHSARGECRSAQLSEQVREYTHDAAGRTIRIEERTSTVPIDIGSLSPPSSAAGLRNVQRVEDQIVASLGILVESDNWVLNGAGDRLSASMTPAAGPTTTIEYTAGPFDTYASVGGQQVTYDSAGNVLTRGGTSFRYDGFGRLRELGTRSFAYDALGRLQRIAGAGAVIDVLHAGGRPVEWRVGGSVAGQVVSVGGRAWLVAADGGDYVPVPDGAGSIVAWIDGAGSVAGRVDFDPFGTVRQMNGVQPSPLGFHGHWRDAESGVHLLQARAYDPVLGRFLQRDPLGFVDGTNPYVFARNAPEGYTDLIGYSSTEISSWDRPDPLRVKAVEAFRRYALDFAIAHPDYWQKYVLPFGNPDPFFWLKVDNEYIDHISATIEGAWYLGPLTLVPSLVKGVLNLPHDYLLHIHDATDATASALLSTTPRQGATNLFHAGVSGTNAVLDAMSIVELGTTSTGLLRGVAKPRARIGARAAVLPGYFKNEELAAETAMHLQELARELADLEWGWLRRRQTIGAALGRTGEYYVVGNVPLTLNQTHYAARKLRWAELPAITPAAEGGRIGLLRGRFLHVEEFLVLSSDIVAIAVSTNICSKICAPLLLRMGFKLVLRFN